ncbi:MAG: response regulator [Nitrospirae bacterium]|nr:response regulator [Nitrospirota bacterium]
MSYDLSYKQFLVIDDFGEFRSSIRRMLWSFNVKDIDDAANGEAAIELMSNKSYDVILCDYNLGYNRKDGQQVFEEARHRNLIKFSTVFMMITAENSMQMVMGAVEYQPDDYLIKPFSREVLRTRLERAIKRKSDFELIELAIANKEYLRAIALCDQSTLKIPKNIFEYLKLKGDLCITIGDYQAAMVVYEKVLSIRDISWAKLGIGKVQFYMQDYAAAAETFRSLVQDNSMYIEAYDWLSKSLVANQSLEEAQQVLLTAAELSPKSIFRHKTIGDISFKINDLDISEKSFKKAIDLGQYSFFKNPSHYTSLAKVLVEKKTPEGALDVLKDIRKEFKGSAEASMQASAMEGIVFKEMNRPEDAKKAIQEAMQLMEESAGSISEDIAIDLAKVCFELGDKTAGTRLVQEVVRNNHEDEDVIKKVQAVFKDTQMETEGAKIVSTAQHEIIKTNNQGVRLVEDGRLEEAIEYFEKAANSQKANKIINANAAEALLMFIRKNGKDEQLLLRARQYIERIGKIDPAYNKYQKLLGMYEKLQAESR